MSRSDPFPYLAKSVFLTALLFGLGYLSQVQWSTWDQTPLIWWPAGVGLAALLLGGLRWWPAVVMSSALAYFLQDARMRGPLPTLGLLLGNSIGVIFSAWLLRTVFAFENSITRFKDVPSFMLVGVLLGGAIDATFGLLSIYTFNYANAGRWPIIWAKWLGSHSAATAVATPLILAWANPGRAFRDPRRLAEMVTIAAVTAVAVLLLLGGANAQWLRKYPPAYLIVQYPIATVLCPLVALAAIRHGLKGATGCMAAVACTALYLECTGAGATVGSATQASVLRTSALLFIVSTVGLVGAGLTAQWTRTVQESDERLREANLQLRQLAETIGQVFWLTDWSGRRVLYVSPAYESIWGRTCQSLYDDPRSWDENIHPDDRARARDAFEQQAAQGTYDIEYRLIRPDGALRWIHDRAFPIPNDQGEVVRLAGLSEDISDRKRVEIALQDSEQRYRILFDLCPDAILVILAESPDAGRILSANEATARMHGYTVEELVGMNIRALDGPADSDLVAQRMRTVLRGELTRFEVEHVRKDGSRFPVEVHVSPVRLDGRSCILALDRDITERKQAESQLRASEERYRQLFERDTAGVFYAFVDSTDLDCNDAMVQMFGYSSKADMLRAPRDSFYESAQTRVDYFRRLREEGHIRNLEINLRRRDGTLFEAVESVSLMRDASGREYIQGTVVDVTEARRAERALRDSERRSRLLVDSAPICIHEIDLEGRILSMNPAGLRMLGLRSESEVIGQSILSVVADCDLANVRRFLDEAIRGSSVEFEYTSSTGKVFLKNIVPLLDQDGAVTHLIGLVVDVTVSRRMQNALRDSEARLAAVIQNSPGVAVQWYDQEGRFKLWNLASETMFGFSSEEALGKTPNQLAYTSAEFQRFQAALAELRQTGRPYGPTEFTFHRRNGETGTCLSTMFRIPGDEQGHWFVSMDVDITELRLANERLRASQAHLEASQRISGVGSWELDLVPSDDLNQNPLRWTDEAFRVFRYRPDPNGVSNAEFWSRVHAEDRPAIERAVRRAIDERGVYEIDHRIILPDGSERLVHERAELEIDPRTNAPLKFIGTCQDITDRKAAEAAIARSEQYYRGLFENAHDAILIFRAGDGTVLDVNRRACEVYGYHRDEFIGLSLKDISRTIEAGEQRMRETLGLGRMPAFETRHCRRDGQEIDLEINAAVIEHEGRPAILSINRDVTSRKRAEAELKQRELELAHFARVSTVGEMASGFAHELNQPLTAVVNYCNGAYLRIRQQPNVDRELVGAIETTRAQAQRAAEIIRGLARFLQKGDPLHKRIRVNPVLQGALTLAAADVRRANAQLETDFSLANPQVMADDVQIQQVLLNLVRNALEAMEQKDSTERILKVRTAVVGDFVRVSVSDRGSGLDAELRDKVFTPFFTTKHSGMGMGLPISRSIVNAHGGRMWVSTNTDRGATFEFSIPLAP